MTSPSTAEIVRVSPSGSVSFAIKSRVLGLEADILPKVSLTAVGASLLAVTVTLTAPFVEPPSPSVTQ